MRRFVLLLVLIIVPGLTIAPSFAGASLAGFVPHKATPVREKGPRACATPGRSTKQSSTGGKKPSASCATATRKQPAKKTPAKKTPRARHSSKSPATPAGTIRKATTTPKPTSTSTPTPTPTATPTATEASGQVLTLPASSASISIRAVLPGDYGVAFMVCGLPAGVTASFTPSLAVAAADSASPTGASARATLTIITPRATEVRSYELRIDTYFQDPSGKPTWSLPAGGQVDPPGVVLAVKPDHDTILTPMSSPPPAGFESCSAVPPSFQPQPTPTPNPSGVTVTAGVTNANPATGQTETVFGKIMSNGQPVQSVPMSTHWYFYNGVETCGSITNANGWASCTLPVASSIPNYQVNVQVSFTLNGQTYTTYAAFTTSG